MSKRFVGPQQNGKHTYIHTYINFIKVSRYLAKKLIVDTIYRFSKN